MLSLVTPHQLSRRSELYHQLASLTSAGVNLHQACRILEKAPPARSFQRPLQQLIVRLEDGYSVTESLHGLGKWMPSFDIALISAGEQSGRLDQCYRLLAGYYQERAQLARSLISDLIYPGFVFHAAIFLFPLPRFFLQGDWSGFLSHVLAILLPLYGVALGLAYLFQARRGEVLRSITERALHAIPLLGPARRELALARLAAALEALISAGVPIVQAWDTAAEACGSFTLRRAIVQWRPRVVSEGETPAEVLMKSPVFPPLFSSLYATGEISGQLDTTLKRLQEMFQDSASRKLHAFAAWAPRLLYFGIALYVAYKVIGFYTDYFQQIGRIME